MSEENMNQTAENLAEVLFSAAGIAVNSAPYDRTIEARIVRCINPAVAEYELSVQNSTGNIRAYCDPSIVYRKNDMVYVLIPKNDPYADKQILGMTEASRVDTAGHNEEGRYLVDCVLDGNNNFTPQDFAFDDFYSLLRIGKTAFTVQAKIETDFGNINISTLANEIENYGIEITAKFKDGDKKYILDINDISGNPYNLSGDFYQYKVFEDDFTNLIEITGTIVFLKAVENQSYAYSINIPKIHLQVRRDDIEPVTKTEYFYCYTTDGDGITPPTNGWVTKENLIKVDGAKYLWEWKKVTVIAYEKKPGTEWYQITSTETNDYRATSQEGAPEEQPSNAATEAARLGTIDVFNALTNSGSDQGIFYGYIDKNSNTIKKVRPYYTSAGGGSKISETFSVVEEGANGEYQGSNIARNSFGLYVNASMIKTGILQVGGESATQNGVAVPSTLNPPVLWVNMDKPDDTIIGGWNSAFRSLTSWNKDSDGTIYMTALQNPWKINDTLTTPADRVFAAGPVAKFKGTATDDTLLKDAFVEGEGSVIPAYENYKVKDFKPWMLSSWKTAPFRVDKDGSLYATQGQIGGWQLTEYFLNRDPQAGKDNGIIFRTGGYGDVDIKDQMPALSIGYTNKNSQDSRSGVFRVYQDGSMYSTSGNIAGWEIKPWSLSNYYKNGNQWYVMGLQNAWGGGFDNCIGIGTVASEGASWDTCQFYVDKYGKMHSTAGEIGGWTINKNYLQDTKGYMILDPSNSAIKLKRQTTKIKTDYPIVQGDSYDGTTIHIAIMADSRGIKGESYVFKEYYNDGIRKVAVKFTVDDSGKGTLATNGLVNSASAYQHIVVSDKYAYAYFISTTRYSDDPDWISPGEGVNDGNDVEATFLGTIDTNLSYSEMNGNHAFLDSLVNSFVHFFFKNEVVSLTPDTFIPG